jgi:hypothetical protein
MPSEEDRWKTGDLRNTIGHTHGATGAVTGGVEGHVVSEPLTDPEGRHYGGPTVTGKRGNPRKNG